MASSFYCGDVNTHLLNCTYTSNKFIYAIDSAAFEQQF